jgi:hypothetical protein
MNDDSSEPLLKPSVTSSVASGGEVMNLKQFDEHPELKGVELRMDYLLHTQEQQPLPHLQQTLWL